MSVIFVGCPTYNGSLDSGTARGIFQTATEKHQVIPCIASGSLLTSNCNKLWVSCLNSILDGHPIKWFALLHADIEPCENWLDILVDEAEKHDADMMAAMVAIKDSRGVTSTAIGGWNERGRAGALGRLTMRQIWHPDFPETFDMAMAAEALANLPEPLRVEGIPETTLWNNTGCMVVRADRIGDGRVCFETREGIEQLPDGHWRHWDFSEDWYFAQAVADAGGKVMATRKVTCQHKGGAAFPNDKPWGSVANDCSFRILEAV